MKLLIMLGSLAVVGIHAASAMASETDQYFAWGRTIQDGTEVYNQHVNGIIGKVLTKLNKKGGHRYSCYQVSNKLRKKLAVDALEVEFLPGHFNALHRVPETRSDFDDYEKFSYYGFWNTSGVLHWIPTSPTIYVAGVRFGIDKTQHFFSTGWRQFNHFLEARQAGATREHAFEVAIDYGVSTEKSYLGLRTSKVFSFADLEANFQGVLFYESLCFSDKPRLRQVSSGDWVFEGRFDWSDYVTPYWDESFNNSTFAKYRWKYTRKRMLNYCENLKSPQLARMSMREVYAVNQKEPSFAMKYVEKLKAQRKTPDPAKYSLEAVCAAAGR